MTGAVKIFSPLSQKECLSRDKASIEVSRGQVQKDRFFETYLTLGLSDIETRNYLL